MAAAKVIENTRPIGRVPAAESQARSLARLTPDQQCIAWQKAVSTAPDGGVQGDGGGDRSTWGIVGSHDWVNHKRGLA